MSTKIKINASSFILENELEFEFIRASGPGGQKVNKTSSAVKLKFNIKEAEGISEETKTRIFNSEGNRISKDGYLIIDSRIYRSQIKNKQEAVNRLIDIVKKAARKRKKRKGTQPTQNSREKRLQQKKRRSLIKGKRKNPAYTD